MRILASLAAMGSVLAISACTPAIPDSAAGVGLDNDPFVAGPTPGATINGDPLVPPVRIAETPLDPNTLPAAPRSAGSVSSAGSFGAASATGATNDDIARETATALAAAQGNSGVAPLEASPANPAPQIVGNAAISDENSFEAVASRQTIESDAERLAQQRAQYQVVAPTAVPTVAAANRDPNIVKYALSTRNQPGERLYSRAGINLKSRSARNCAGFASSELAQIAFLEAGGPRKDRQSLDPDGDGFACDWDPRPYRLAIQN